MNSSRSLHHQRQAAIISTPTHTRRPTQLLLSSALPLHQNFNDDDSENDGTKLHQVEVLSDDDSLTPSQIESLQPSNNLLSTVKEFFIGKKAKFNRESLSKLGMSALLAYGFVSNVSGVIAVSSAWFIFCKKVSNRYRLHYLLCAFVSTPPSYIGAMYISPTRKPTTHVSIIAQTGVSPMAPGQKPAFLAMYAGFTLMLNIVRPARFALSMAISPYFERIRKAIQRKFGVSPKGAAVLMIIFINLMGTCSLMALGVGLASVLSGVPVWAT
jgi:hypothetical protein